MLFKDPLAEYLAEGGKIGFRLTPEEQARRQAEEEAARKAAEEAAAAEVPVVEEVVDTVPNNDPNYSSGDMSRWTSEDWTRWLGEQGMVGGQSSAFGADWGAAIANYQAPTTVPTTTVPNFNMDSEGIPYNNTFDEHSYGIPNYQGSIPQTTANTSVAYNPQEVVSSGSSINNRVSFGNVDGNQSFYLNANR